MFDRDAWADCFSVITSRRSSDLMMSTEANEAMSSEDDEPEHGCHTHKKMMSLRRTIVGRAGREQKKQAVRDHTTESNDAVHCIPFPSICDLSRLLFFCTAGIQHSLVSWCDPYPRAHCSARKHVPDGSATTPAQ